MKLYVVCAPDAPALPDLSPRQRALLVAIAEYTAGHDRPPAVRDIGAMTGLVPSMVAFYLGVLRQHGFVSFTPGARRTIALTDRVVVQHESGGVIATPKAAR